MGQALAELGFSCLLFDFAGCGESDGQWEEISLTRHIGDLSDVVRWCREAGFGEIILNGRSFGGAVSLCYAVLDQCVAGVCTWAAPANPVDLFRRLAGGAVAGPGNQIVELTGDEGVVRLRKSFFYDLERHDVLGSVARISPRPLLVIHGTDDEVVDPGDARLLVESAGAPKQLCLVKGADHRFSMHLDEVWDSFFKWLNHLFSL
jgi:putative redox protein